MGKVGERIVLYCHCPRDAKICQSCLPSVSQFLIDVLVPSYFHIGFQATFLHSLEIFASTQNVNMIYTIFLMHEILLHWVKMMTVCAFPQTAHFRQAHLWNIHMVFYWSTPSSKMHCRHSTDSLDRYNMDTAIWKWDSSKFLSHFYSICNKQT